MTDIAPTTPSRYDAIGAGYARRRRSDPRIAAAIEAALGDARTVVDVGAGTGSYEPRDRWVLAVEPSDVMAAQRRPDAAPALCASADALPLRDDAVDAAMAVLTVHHWGADRERGVRELRRVARGPVVIVTFDPEVHRATWLVSEYVPEVDGSEFPALDDLAAWLGGTVITTTLPVAAETPDETFGAFWAHPERVLDPSARAATSGFALLAGEIVDRVTTELARDLADGTWDARHGELRSLTELDVGLRLVVGRPRPT